MKIKRYKQSSFLIEIQGIHLYIDPYGIPKGETPADFILVTHAHSDHYEKSSVNNIFNESTILIAPKSCSKILEDWNGVGLNPGEIYKKEDFKIKAVPMYTEGFIRKLFHNKSKNLCGYIIYVGETRIYHSGDSDFIQEMKDLKEINIAFLPVGGFFTMNKDDAIEAIKVIQPEKFIPMHELRTDLDKFKKISSNQVLNTEIIVLKKDSLIEMN
jgi:L-ascorbate metabolism protein UlaG (beta-lactamase superfamily)